MWFALNSLASYCPSPLTGLLLISHCTTLHYSRDRHNRNTQASWLLLHKSVIAYCPRAHATYSLITQCPCHQHTRILTICQWQNAATTTHNSELTQHLTYIIQLTPAFATLEYSLLAIKLIIQSRLCICCNLICIASFVLCSVQICHEPTLRL